MNAWIKGYLPGIMLAVVITACNNQSTSTQKTDGTLSIAQTDSLTAELDSLSKHTLMPGFAVALVSGDTVIYKNGFGYADVESQKPFTTETINAVASVSKTFVAVALMRLVDSGIINLDDPVNTILPYQIINPWFPSDSITIRHLVTHTSTLTQEFDPEDAGGSIVCAFKGTALFKIQISVFFVLCGSKNKQANLHHLGTKISHRA